MQKTRTPWGLADGETRRAEGIVSYSTPSHGGMKLCRALNARMPEYMRAPGGWYEEDVAYTKVIVVFPDKFSTDEVDNAKRAFREWFPGEYEKFYGIQLQDREKNEREETRGKQLEDYETDLEDA